MAETNPWRDKYRRTLVQQEQLEKTLAAQQAILHRAVTTLCSAAEGYDNTMDERLQAIRSSVKHNDVAGFDRMLKSLPRVTEEVEKRQQDQWKEVVKELGSIATQVHKQSPDADIKPALKHFKKQLPNGTPLIPATLKRLLGQLSDLQKQALTNSPKQGGGLFGKLFKEKDEADNTASQSTEPSNKAEEAAWEEVDENTLNIENQSVEGEVIKEGEETLPYDRERNIPEALLEQHYQEEQKSPDVPDRVSIILIELLDHFKTVPAAEQKATKARNRIAQGLRWFELAPTLEDIRDFVLQAYIGADHDYQQYLEHLYGELTEILGALGVSIETEQRVRTAADTLHSSVSDGMATISLALKEQNNIDVLKQAVEGHVHQLQTALSDFKSQSSVSASDEDSLALQLQALADKVQEMEKKDEDVRKQLEAEKQRALTDALTGLPNREAYNERSHQEMLRWQRYAHPLTMAVIDIDFFKKINDNYGHQTGDKVLKIVSSAVAKRLREVDFMARFGGEEFVILLPETGADNALLMLNRIREGLAKAPFRYKDQKINITVSIGIAEFKEGDTKETVFEKADQALYKAKETGRNKCIVADD
ncbi:MAG: GGDEF domain-containing protein [Cellvibrionaceae bacterium]